MSLRRVWIGSPNYSSRGGSGVRLIVLHSSEGATTYRSLGNFFANPSSGVSSHVGIDDTPNEIGEYVNRNNKAWTAANANPVAVQAELCCPSGASANWTRADWNSHPTMLANTAAWIAEEARAFNIPIRNVGTDAQRGAAGVCQHRDLGTWGGNHYDNGANFPIDDVIAMATGGGPAPEPAPPPEDDDVANLTICAAVGRGEQYVTDMVTFKTFIPNPDAGNHILWCLVASGAKVYYQTQDTWNNPIRVPKEVLDQLPTTKA